MNFYLADTAGANLKPSSENQHDIKIAIKIISFPVGLAAALVLRSEL